MVVVGELNADLIVAGDVTPAFGQVEKLVDDATLTIGSSSAIFACGVAKLGLRVAFIGKVGDDIFGHFMKQSLAARGIDVSGVIVDPTLKTGLTIILSRSDDRALLTYLGSISALTYADVDLSLLDRARHVHLGSYYLLDGLRPDCPRLFAEAKQRGLTVSIDTNYDPSEQWQGGLMETLAHVDVFLPNEVELHAISRQPDTESALRAMHQRVGLVAVKQGAKGATAIHNGALITAGSIPVSVVDTTGAGDSFDAGFVYGYLNGWQIADALRMGCICGALSTRAAGGTSAQATLQEAMPYLDANKTR
jgi:sugar/nucleoside kinase (ribokinase family)